LLTPYSSDEYVQIVPPPLIRQRPSYPPTCPGDNRNAASFPCIQQEVEPVFGKVHHATSIHDSSIARMMIRAGLGQGPCVLQSLPL